MTGVDRELGGASLRERRGAVVREHMESEDRHEFDATIETFSHPRYESCRRFCNQLVPIAGRLLRTSVESQTRVRLPSLPFTCRSSTDTRRRATHRVTR